MTTMQRGALEAGVILLLVAALAWEHAAGARTQRQLDQAVQKAAADSVRGDSTVQAWTDSTELHKQTAELAGQSSATYQGKARILGQQAHTLADSLGKQKAVDSAAFAEYVTLRDQQDSAQRAALAADSTRAAALLLIIGQDSLTIKALHSQLTDEHAKLVAALQRPVRARCAPNLGVGVAVGWGSAAGVTASFSCQL